MEAEDSALCGQHLTSLLLSGMAVQRFVFASRSRKAPQEEHTSGYTPGPSAALSTPRQPAQRRHLLISGRFNSQEKLSYMRSVKRVLDSEGVPRSDR